MANEEHLARLKQGVEAWNQWRTANPGIRPDLSEAHLARENLREADLTGAHLYRANLTGADLTEAHLTGAGLAYANLYRANLTGADLTKADLHNALLAYAHLTEANLSRANLTFASLSRASLSRADLTYANLYRANIGWTSFADVDLSTARGLETALHGGPSTIGIDTLYRSKGNIPQAFLRGAGVPDEMISYSKSLVGRPFEFYSCFISYSSKDEEFAKRLHSDLQNQGVRCWFAPEDIQGGRKLHEQIDQAIRIHERLLLILSSHSMNSEWVKTEIAKARQREVQEHRQVLFPVRLVPFEAMQAWECFDADTGKDAAREIREYFIPDFSNWKNYDAYQKAFQRLLRDLKPNTALL
jgi:TIR domain/Pentapeptide repeats (8 copies)